MKHITIQNRLYFNDDGDVTDECWLLYVDKNLKYTYSTKEEAEKAICVWGRIYNERL